jgi:glycosyltransferase involved in cell wall biosynthesis
MHVHDLAVGLRALGDDVVVYTPRAGVVAEAVRDRGGVDVVTSLEDLPWRPDVIHGHHTLETVAAALAHPDVPVVFTCHGQGWMAEPPRLSSLVEWIAVGTATVTRLGAAGVPPDRVSLIPNGVDTERFRPTRAAPPRSPRRALVFSNNAAPGGWVEVVRATCAQRGIEVEVAGRAWGRALDAPEEVLPEFDLVFARGRCAREAIASGCAVVLTDVEGLAGWSIGITSSDTTRGRWERPS